jgi:type VI secretion system protein ImpC
MAKQSSQHKLDRVRAPRVHIMYCTEVGAATDRREIPFVIGVLGDFSGLHRQPFRNRKFLSIDFDNFNAVMEGLCPRVHFKIPSSFGGGEMEVDLTFRAIEDFEPDSLINRLDPLARLRISQTPEDAETLQRHVHRILHAPEFQAVESAWRSLWYLLSQTETGSQLKINLLDVSKRELLKDFGRAQDFTHTYLFKILYEEPFGAFGSDPYGILLGNFTFAASPEDIKVLTGLSQIASMCHAPFIAGAAPAMFGMESFDQIYMTRDLSRTFDSTQFAKWKAFRDSEDSHFIGLALPRVLLRSPYGIRPSVPGDFLYEEDIRGSRDLLWGNAAFAFGACVANAFARFGWCGAIRGVEGGGIVEGLPTWISRVDNEAETRSCVEIAITDRREKEISDLGFLALTQAINSDFAVFFSAPSCCRPKQYAADAANVNSRLSCQLQYVLTASRFMHYLKVMARDSLESYRSRADLERHFNRWISEYVNVDDQASPSIRAQMPLREALINVSDDLNRPGAYRVVAFLRPHFQLDELSVSLRVVGFIP